MNRRLKRRLPFAAYAALIFNAAICLAPFIGARAVSSAYGDRKPQFEATNEALAHVESGRAKGKVVITLK